MCLGRRVGIVHPLKRVETETESAAGIVVPVIAAVPVSAERVPAGRAVAGIAAVEIAVATAAVAVEAGQAEKPNRQRE